MSLPRKNWSRFSRGPFARLVPVVYRNQTIGKIGRFSVAKTPTYLLSMWPRIYRTSRYKALWPSMHNGHRFFPDNFNVPYLKYSARVFNRTADFSARGYVRPNCPLKPLQGFGGSRVMMTPGLRAVSLFGYFFTQYRREAFRNFPGQVHNWHTRHNPVMVGVHG